MKEELFDELLAGIREGGAIWRGEQAPAAVIVVPASPADEIRATRKAFGLSAPKFAALLGISPRTLEGWEQGHREPDGPARVLLRLAKDHPEVVLQTVRSLTDGAESAVVKGARGGDYSEKLAKLQERPPSVLRSETKNHVVDRKNTHVVPAKSGKGEWVVVRSAAASGPKNKDPLPPRDRAASIKVKRGGRK